MSSQLTKAILFLIVVLVLSGYQVRESQAVKIRFIEKPDSDFTTTPILADSVQSKRLLSEYIPHESNYTVGLRGDVDIGYYYTSMFIGYPPQMETVIIDSGSSITAVPCTSIKTIY